MTQTEKDTAVQELQARAKDYQAEIGFLTLQAQAGAERIAELKTLFADGQRRFQVLQQTQVSAPASAAEVPNA